MENKLLNFNYELYQPSHNEYVLSHRDKYFKIETLLYKILLIGKSSVSINEIHNKLNLPDVSLQDLSLVIDNNIIPVLQQKNEEEEKASGYWLKFELLNADWTKKIASPFAFIYGKAFYLVLAAMVVINVVGLSQLSVFSKGMSFVDVQFLPFYYLGLLMIILMHEVGHAAASIKSGIFPRGIGLGFYTVMPVMYADLTDAWRVSKKSKIKINLGGIYIQLIFNFGLFALTYFTDSSSFLHAITYNLMFTNTIIIIMNLIPFLKFDGYWILADSLSIPDLLERSNKTLRAFFVKADPFAEQKKREFNFNTVFIFIFSLLRVAYIAMMVVGIFSFIIYSFSRTLKFIMNIPYMEFTEVTFKDGLVRLISITIIYLLTKNYRKVFINYFRKKR